MCVWKKTENGNLGLKWIIYKTISTFWLASEGFTRIGDVEFLDLLNSFWVKKRIDALIFHVDRWVGSCFTCWDASSLSGLDGWDALLNFFSQIEIEIFSHNHKYLQKERTMWKMKALGNWIVKSKSNRWLKSKGYNKLFSFFHNNQLFSIDSPLIFLIFNYIIRL
jgi:hypothetical protein